MRRKEFGAVLLGLVGITAFTGCKSRISKSAYDVELGDPYLCGRCGHLIRSTEDLEGTRCPRCYAKAMSKITEEEAETILAEAKAE